MSKFCYSVCKYLFLSFCLFNIFNHHVEGQRVFEDILLRDFVIPAVTPTFEVTELEKTSRKFTTRREGPCSFDNVVSWTATGGKFRYFNKDGALIEGKILSFSLVGRMSSKLSPCPFSLEIEPNKINIKIVLTNSFNVNSYGGIITLETGQTAEISNSAAIKISQNLPPSLSVTRLDGKFALKTSGKLNWTNAKFKFQELPNTISLNLISQPGAIKEFELPFKTNIPSVTKAQFNYRLPNEIKNQIFPINTSNYRARVKILAMDNLLVTLNPNGLAMQIQNFSGNGEITAKSNTTQQIPILFNGDASVKSLSAIADFSLFQAEMKNISFTGLKLSPLTENQDRLAINSYQVSNSIYNKKIRSINKPINNTTLFRSASYKLEETREIPIQARTLCYQITEDQLIDIKQLSMSSLTDRQTEAIRVSQEALDRIDNADFVVHFPSKDIEQLIENFSLKELGQQIDVEFGNQTILFCADFSSLAQLSGLPIINTKIILKVSPSFEVADVERDGQRKQELALVLRYEVCQGNLVNTDLTGKTTILDEVYLSVKKQIEEADKRKASKVVIPLPLNFIKPLNLNKSKTDEKGNKTEVKAKKIETTISPVPNMTVVFVDMKGIHLLGKVNIKVEEK